MKLGFTGTRKGMSDWQMRRFKEVLRFHRPEEFHHGDCQGADAQAHKLVRQTLPDCRIVAHPCDLPRWRANCKADLILEPMGPLHRNRLIVSAVDEMVATPEQDQESAAGGTWFTIRESRRVGKPIEVIERVDPYSEYSQDKERKP